MKYSVFDQICIIKYSVIVILFSISIKLPNILKWLNVNKLCQNVSTSKLMLFHMPQKVVPCLSRSLYSLESGCVYNFNILCIIINCHLDWKLHSIGITIARTIRLFRKLKFMLDIFYISTYNSLIWPHTHF